MKRAITFLSAVILLSFYTLPSFAQDDVYYDPNKDKGYQESRQTYENNSQQNNTDPNNYSQQQQNQTTDKTDGYGNANDNPANKYDPRDNYSSTTNANDANYYATDASYYDEDYDTYFYTTRLHRYYAPNYGVNYYSYYFTPSYYNGWDSWNTSVVVSTPWYSNPWWRWNRHAYRPVVVYDPYYSPYWDWSWGCNSYSYYNTWGYPSYGLGSCGYYNGYSTWGYNGWGYNNGGFCGGYYNGYSNGYHNGYNDGWNTAYGGYGHNYYNGPRHHKDLDIPSSTGKGTGTGTPTGTTNPATGVVRAKEHEIQVNKDRQPVDVQNTNIPREGIQRPVTNSEPVKSREGVNIATTSPYNTNEPKVTVRPTDEPTNIHSTTGRWEERNLTPAPNVNTQPTQSDWNTNRNDVRQRNEQQNNNYGNHPVEQPRENVWNQQPRQVERPRQIEQQRPVEQPRQIEQPRQVEQPRQIQQQRPAEQPRQMEQRNFNAQPRMEQPRMEQPRQMEQRNFNSQPRMEQPRNNFQPSQQRSFSPQGGGNGGRRH